MDADLRLNYAQFYSPFGLLWLAIESLYSVLVMKIPDWEVMMSKVLKTLLASLILFTPAIASATTSSYASLSNFSYEVTGPGVSATPGTFLAVSSGTVNGASTAASTNVIGADFSFELPTHFITDGTNNASGGAKYAPGDASSIIFSQTDMNNSNFSFVNTWAQIRIDYLANTTFTLSADAYLNINPEPGQQAFASTAIDLNSSHSENVRLGQLAFSPFTGSERLSVTFFSPKDETLYLTLTSYVTANVMEEPPVSTVPEPETYGLMLAGLSLIGFMARRRNKT